MSMREFTTALMDVLSSLYGQDNVYQYAGELDVAYPYVTFAVESSGETMEYAGMTNKNTGGLTDYPVRISCWCNEYDQASERLDEVIETLTTRNALTLQTKAVTMTTVLSREVIEEELVEQDNELVYRGYTLIEFKLNEGI